MGSSVDINRNTHDCFDLFGETFLSLLTRFEVQHWIL